MKVEEDYGYIKIKLEDLIKENEISKNPKLAHKSGSCKELSLINIAMERLRG